MEHYALVYVDYEGLNLLSLGDKLSIYYDYSEYKKGIENLKEKYKDELKKYDSREDIDALPNEYYKSEYSSKEVERLCIMGYRNNKINCLCEEFGIELKEQIFY